MRNLPKITQYLIIVCKSIRYTSICNDPSNNTSTDDSFFLSKMLLQHLQCCLHQLHIKTINMPLTDYKEINAKMQHKHR